jgi:hypothetical protein
LNTGQNFIEIERHPSSDHTTICHDPPETLSETMEQNNPRSHSLCKRKRIVLGSTTVFAKIGCNEVSVVSKGKLKCRAFTFRAHQTFSGHPHS